MTQARHLRHGEGPGGRTAVYRLYDAADRLLYVGITHDLVSRFRKHAQDKAWWPQVAFKAIVWHDTRLGAAIEEAYAIGCESPEFNLMRKSDVRLGFERGGVSGRSSRAHLLQRAKAVAAGVVEVESPERNFPAFCFRVRRGWGLRFTSIEFPTLPAMSALAVESLDPEPTTSELHAMAHEAVVRHLGLPADSVTVSLHYA